MPTYQGEYAPDDQREVTMGTSDIPGEPERTGPREQTMREGETRSPESAQQDSGTAQDLRTDRIENAQADAIVLGATSDRPDLIVRADANRAMYEPSEG